jgi:hypothetical protein
MYTGSWHAHRRHGHGEQSYRNGTRYSGDWLMNKRHGWGKLIDHHTDTIIYEVETRSVSMRYGTNASILCSIKGSWREDLMHGEGSYRIGESYVYRDGRMINNYPEGWPFRIRIAGDLKPTISLSDKPLTIAVDIIRSSDDAHRIEADCGRKVRLRCGQRTEQPTADSVPTPL